jgi:predicted RNA-binding protein with PIN domain
MLHRLLVCVIASLALLTTGLPFNLAFQVGVSPTRQSAFSSVQSSGQLTFQSATHSPSTPSCCHRSLALYMAKGDGKKRRKKASEVVNETPVAKPQPIVPRVLSTINIPVRHQIRMAQFNKASQQGSTSFRQKVVRTSYRRIMSDEDWALQTEQRKAQSWDVVLNQTLASPLLIVDGYNIIYKWARLKKHMTAGDTQRARQLLMDDLENLRIIKGWRIECVFDGRQRSTTGVLGDSPGNKVTPLDQATRSSVSKYGVRIVYTGVGTEADTYIEAKCHQAQNVTHGRLTSSLILATDDGMLRLAGQRAGAMCMSADRFIDELKGVRQAVDYQVEAAVAKVNGVAMRPKSLQEARIHLGRFGRRSVLIEDKRNRTKTKRGSEIELPEIELKVEEPVNGIPWWAQVPNHTVVSRRG